jgi:hypothetical protein
LSQTHAATVPPRRVTRSHLAQTGDRIAHEVHHELRERGVELSVAERKRLGRRGADVDAGMALAAGRDERLRRIDRGDRRRGDPRDELGFQRARAAADVEHALGADPGMQ